MTRENDNSPPLRLPPHNHEAEIQLLGAILSNNRAYAQVTGFLKAEHFADDRHGRIFEACVKLIDRGQSASATTIRGYFEQDSSLSNVGGVAYIAKVAVAAVTTINAGQHGRIILDCWQRRQMISRLNEAVDQLHDVSLDTTAADVAVGVVGDVEKLTIDTSATFKTSRQVRESITESLKRPLVYHPTGIEPLDKVLSGGLYPGKAVALCGRFKSGKTLGAGQASQNLARAGVRHLYVCGEMGPAEIEQRALAAEIGVNSVSFLKERDRSNPGFVSMVGQAAISASENVLYADMPGMTFDSLRRTCTSAALAEKVSGVIVDYLQLIGGQRRGQSRVELYEEVTQWLANFARKRNVWVLCLAQINQEGGVRHGEGLLLAFDAVVELRRQEDGGTGMWLETRAIRYAPALTVGDALTPALYLDGTIGPRLTEGMGIAA
jgi:replicative DNA helicase